MTPTTRRRLVNGGSLVLAAGFLALALWGVDLSEIGRAFREADYRWLPLLVALVIGSNVMRAWRWNILIDALPDDARPAASGRQTDDSGSASDRSSPRPASSLSSSAQRASSANSLEASFSSIMIGYMVNYALPRMGEVARTANMASRTRFSFSSLFGTVVSERIFDTIVLGLAILSAGGLLLDRLPTLRERFLAPALASLSDLPFVWLAAGTAAGLLLMAGLGRWAWRGVQREQSALHQVWIHTLQPVLSSFRDGMLTLLRAPQRGAIVVSTVGMWGGYLLMAYVPFLMLDLAGSYGIGIVDAWALMAIGALGLLVPSPGGIGSYHYITIQALVYLYDVPEVPAATYAVLAHAAQLVFYVLAGFVVLVVQGTGLDALLPSRSDRVPAAARSQEAAGGTAANGSDDGSAPAPPPEDAPGPDAPGPEAPPDRESAEESPARSTVDPPPAASGSGGSREEQR